MTIKHITADALDCRADVIRLSVSLRFWDSQKEGVEVLIDRERLNLLHGQLERILQENKDFQTW